VIPNGDSNHQGKVVVYETSDLPVLSTNTASWPAIYYKFAQQVSDINIFGPGNVDLDHAACTAVTGLATSDNTNNPVAGWKTTELATTAGTTAFELLVPETFSCTDTDFKCSQCIFIFSAKLSSELSADSQDGNLPAVYIGMDKDDGKLKYSVDGSIANDGQLYPVSVVMTTSINLVQDASTYATPFGLMINVGNSWPRPDCDDGCLSGFNLIEGRLYTLGGNCYLADNSAAGASIASELSLGADCPRECVDADSLTGSDGADVSKPFSELPFNVDVSSLITNPTSLELSSIVAYQNQGTSESPNWVEHSGVFSYVSPNIVISAPIDGNDVQRQQFKFTVSSPTCGKVLNQGV